MRSRGHRRPCTRSRSSPLLVVAVTALLVLPAAAQADSSFQSVFKAYTQGQGRISPCQFSAAVLQSARGQIPADIGQYAPDFSAALGAALAAHARGECSAHAGAGATNGTPSSGTGAGSPTATPGAPGASAPHTAHGPPEPPPGAVLHSGADSGLAPVPVHPTRASSTPVPVILLGVIGLVTAAIALSALLLGGAGMGTHRLGRLRHAFSEAGFRVGATWSEFGHWLRAGR